MYEGSRDICKHIKVMKEKKLRGSRRIQTVKSVE